LHRDDPADDLVSQIKASVFAVVLDTRELAEA
jgi:hypothetical protein